MSTAFHIGQRLSYDGALCTIRYHGSLSGAKGEWLGVEWDNSDRGKHDGSHQGQRIFQCLSTSPTAGSFIRPTRQADPTRTVLEAVQFKYGSKAAANGKIKPGVVSEAEIVHISGKAVEEVGFDKIQEQIGHFDDLKIVLLDDLKVIGLTRDKSLETIERASREFASTCPNITELDLGWNLLQDWQDVVDVCKHLPKLRTLRASGLRLKSFHAEMADGENAFSNIEELHLSETLLKPDQILDVLNCTRVAAFPKLRALSLSLNELSNFSTPQSNLIFPSITNLTLENNSFTTFESLPSIFHHFPSLTSLSLRGNHISSIGDIPPAASFPALIQLSLADNDIPNFIFLSTLPYLFPSLLSLRISKNPLHASLDQLASSDAPYYLTLARIPSLQILNYTTITPRDREEGEIYYLSVAEKDIRSIINTQGLDVATVYTREQYSRYNELCTKYERPNVFSSPLTTSPASASLYPAGSLASRIVHCTFYIPPSFVTTPTTTTTTHTQPEALTWNRPIPRTLNVYSLKSLVHRHFGLAPLQFRLIYESPELDPIPATTRKIWSTKEDWERWGDWDVDISPPGSRARDETMYDPDEEAEGEWIDGVLYRDGARWRRRETEIVDGMRAWGDFLDGGGEREARVRVEPRDLGWEGKRGRWIKAESG